MKKMLSVILSVIFAAAMFTIPVSAASVGLSKTTVRLAVGEEFYLTLNGASGEVKWSVSDRSVVSCGQDNGELYTYYLNPFDGSPIEAEDSGDVLKDG